MAPIDPNETARVWLDYTTGGGSTAQLHTIMMRHNGTGAGDAAAALDALAAFIGAAEPQSFFDGWQVTGARYSEAGSSISLPTGIPAGMVGFVGTGQELANRVSQSREVRFVGRGTTSGRRVSLSLYGMVDNLFNEADFRVERTGAAWVDRMLDVIEGQGVQLFVTVAGDRATFKDYANWQFNSYWEGALRS